MINQQQMRTLQQRTAELLARHGILLTAQERAEIESALVEAGAACNCASDA